MSGRTQGVPSFRWTREVEGITVLVEFLCETGEVEEGRIFEPKHGAGANFSAFNVSGALLAARDYVEVEIEAERLDEGGRSKVSVRVANVLPYVVLKINAFQDRHEKKDVYDMTPCTRRSKNVRSSLVPLSFRRPGDGQAAEGLERHSGCHELA